MNRRAKCDAASGEIRNRTNTHKQTVTDISTPCLSARVDNNLSKCIKLWLHVSYIKSVNVII